MVESETLRNVRTMRQVKTSLDMAGGQKIRTTNSLSKSRQEILHLQLVADSRLRLVLGRERKRFATQEAAADRMSRRALRARERLAATINRNRAITEVRHELQQARWGAKDSTPSNREESNPGKTLVK